MAGYTAIAEVSQTLLEVIRSEIEHREDIVSLDGDHVALVDPDEVSLDDDTRLSLSLYHLEENASMKNSHPRQRTDPNVAAGAPLGVDLYYLVTAHPGGDDSTAQTLEAQRVLGLALQTFHDNAILDDEQLTEELEADGPLTVSLVNQSLDERTNRWSTAPETAFQPSVIYHVSSACIDSRKREELTPVTERETAVDRRPE